MHDSKINTLSNLFCDLAAIQKLINQFTGRTCIWENIIKIGKGLVTDMMINTKCAFGHLKILSCHPQTTCIPAIQGNKQIIFFFTVCFTNMTNLIRIFQKHKFVRYCFQIHICHNVRIIVTNIIIYCHAGTHTVTIRSDMTGYSYCMNTFQI